MDEQQFIAGYVECALWTSSVEEDFAAEHDCAADTNMESWGFTADDIAPEAMSTIESDCRDFIAANLTDLEDYCDARSPEVRDYIAGRSDHGSPNAESYAGYDFWLTRNGCGAGFWDRGLGALGNHLTAASKCYGESYLYIGDDGRVYVS